MNGVCVCVGTCTSLWVGRLWTGKVCLCTYLEEEKTVHGIYNAVPSNLVGLCFKIFGSFYQLL